MNMASPAAGWLRQAALWLMFFLICFGLGYPTLNRYDPSRIGDSRHYFQMVTDGPSASTGHWRYRVLVPFLAKPIARTVESHLGTWNSVSFSLLVVNSAFCASTALVLTLIAQACGVPSAAGLIAALAYLLNFNVANSHLAGLVDSAEAFPMACLFLLLQRRWWKLLPLLGPLGALGKETFVPLALLFACGWVWREARKPLVEIGLMAASGLLTVMLIHSLVEGRLVTPLEIAGLERRVHTVSGLVRAALAPLTSWVVWITFVWMLPFAASGVRRLPREALLATVLGLAGAFALVVWNEAGSNASRPLFDVAGPYLCLAFALGITGTPVLKSQSG
jgi:hypothetical protein